MIDVVLEKGKDLMLGKLRVTRLVEADLKLLINHSYEIELKITLKKKTRCLSKIPNKGKSIK